MHFLPTWGTGSKLTKGKVRLPANVTLKIAENGGSPILKKRPRGRSRGLVVCQDGTPAYAGPALLVVASQERRGEIGGRALVIATLALAAGTAVTMAFAARSAVVTITARSTVVAIPARSACG